MRKRAISILLTLIFLMGILPLSNFEVEAAWEDDYACVAYKKLLNL